MILYGLGMCVMFAFSNGCATQKTTVVDAGDVRAGDGTAPLSG